MPVDTQHPRLHLASRSPRRRELLGQIGIGFDTLLLRSSPRDDRALDETPLTGEGPVDYVERIARSKAEHGWRIVSWRRLLSQPALAADTTIELAGELIGKPRDTDDARRILRRLSGNTHRVLTAVAIAFETRMELALSISEVRFRPLDEGRDRSLCRQWRADGQGRAPTASRGAPGCSSSILQAATAG
jgi:septum formation protein